MALGCFLTLTVLLESCAPPAAVAAFAANAEKTTETGAALFADLQGSCVRRHRGMEPVSPIFFPAALRATADAGAPAEMPQCTAFAPEGEALAKASQVLSGYFRAMQQLASFDNSSVSGAGERTGLNIAVASGLNVTQVDSVSKLASLLTQAFTEGYRQRDLVKMLSQADPSIASLTQGFEDIVAKDYEGLLREEQQTLAAQYQAVADVKEPAMILLLNRAFSSDLNELKQRKSAAEAYVQGLQQIREGHHTLTKMAQNLKPRELGLALQPYTNKLEGLLPTLQKQ